MTRAGKGSKPGRSKRTSWDFCKVEECDKTTQGGSLGFCHTHYVAARRGAFDRVTGERLRDNLRVSSYGNGAHCSVEGCARRPRAQGLCPAHWQRVKNGLPLEGKVLQRKGKEPIPCLVEGCEVRAISRRMCGKHSEQLRRGILGPDGSKLRDPLPGGRPRTKEKWIGQHGYVLVQAPKGHPSARLDGTILEHRLIMEQHLGAYLSSTEIIHHKNGNRQDNRLENLELLDGRARKGPGHSPAHNFDPKIAAQVLLQEPDIPSRLKKELERYLMGKK